MSSKKLINFSRRFYTGFTRTNFRYNHRKSNYHKFYSTQSQNSFKPIPYIAIGIGIGLATGYYLATQIITDNPKPSATGIGHTQTFKERFYEYADVEKDGEKYMTPKAFISSLLPKRLNVPKWVAYPRKEGKLLIERQLEEDKNLQLLLKMADSNSDGLISLTEYCFFLTLLSSNVRQFQIAFKMFDKDGDGSIDIDEFASVLNANCKDPSISFKDDPLLRSFFGEDGKGKLKFEDFEKFVTSLKDEMLRQEFKQFDVEATGLISIHAFSELITNSVHFNSIRGIPAFKQRLNILKTRGFFAPTGRVDFETFVAFDRLSQNIDDIAMAIHLYAAAGMPITRNDFKRAVAKVAGIDVPQRVEDLVFALFDENGDGTLQYDELISVLESRAENRNMLQIPTN